MPGKYGSVSATVTIDDHGGTPRIITSHVLTITGLKIAQLTQETTPLGQAYQSSLPTGKQQFGPVEIAGNWDTSATTGSHAVFATLETSPQDSTRTLVVVPGDGKTLTCEGRCVDFELVLTNGQLTGYKSTFVQDGLAAWT